MANTELRLGQCTMHLYDGRVFVLTGLTVDQVTNMMNELQITPRDVASVIHIVDLKTGPRVH
jgi:hypothetical protein